MKRISLFLMATLLGVSAFARQIGENEARAIASARLSGCGQVPARVKSNVANSNGNTAPLYMFSAKGGGFAIIAGDDCMPNMVLAYSETSTLDIDNCSPAMQAWLDEMSAFIAAGDFSKVSRTSLDYSNPVAPLVKSKWDQEDPYNLLTPKGTTGKNCLTGCAATAAAQILNYWQYPKEGGLCQHSYVWNGQTLSVDFRNSRYDWENMANVYDANATDAQKAAVAKLMYDCGIAMNMDYGESVSSTTSINCALGLADVFGFSKAMRLRERDTSTSDEWFETVKGELDAARPLLYMGCTASNEGHAFVCDGYDSEGLFHINWGWGGYNDGYYDLNTLDPQGQGSGGAASGQGFSEGQVIITGLQPQKDDDPVAEGWEMSVYSYYVLPQDTEGSHFKMQILLLNTGFRPFTGTISQTLYKDGVPVEGEEDEIIAEVTEPVASGEVYEISLDSIDAASFEDGKWTFSLTVADLATPGVSRSVHMYKSTPPLEFEIKDGKLVYDPRPIILLDECTSEDLDLYITAQDGVRSKFSNLYLVLKNVSGITYHNGFTIKLTYDNGVMMDKTQRAIHLYEAQTIPPGEAIKLQCSICYNVASEVKLEVVENPVGEDQSPEALFKENEITFESADAYHELIFAGDPSYEENAGKVTFTVPVASCMGNPASTDPDFEYEMERTIECVVYDPVAQAIVASDKQTYSGKWHEEKKLVFSPEPALKNGSYVVLFFYKSMPNLLGQVLDLNLGVEEGNDGFPITISTSGIVDLTTDINNDSVEVYSISGVRMTDLRTLAPGIYLCRKGNGFSKVVVK